MLVGLRSAPCPPTPGPNKPLLEGHSTCPSPPHARSPLTPCDAAPSRHDLLPRAAVDCALFTSDVRGASPSPLHLGELGQPRHSSVIAVFPLRSPDPCMSAQHAKAAKAQSPFPNSAAARTVRLILRITPPSLLHAPGFVEQLRECSQSLPVRCRLPSFLGGEPTKSGAVGSPCRKAVALELGSHLLRHRAFRITGLSI